MFYDFPIINHYNDVVSVIENCPEFSIKYDEENRIVLICYNVAFGDTFTPINSVEDTIRRECRGITFDMDTGRVISRKYHKFFNLNEREETQEHNVDVSTQHLLMEKLDGSMVVPLFLKNGMVWHTKKGVSDVSKQVDVYTANLENYKQFAKKMWDSDMTPIFEWCSRLNRVVIDHGEASLVLTAIRHNVSGMYVSYEDMKIYAGEFDIPVVKVWDTKNALDPEVVNEIRNLVNDEGRVIRFDNGHMLKIKGEWYCRIHKSLDILRFEKDIVNLIVNEQIDDVKPFMSEFLRNDIERFEKIVNNGIVNTAVSVYNDAKRIYADYNGDRKRFAEHVDLNNPISLMKNFYFKAINANSVDDMIEVVKKCVRNHVSSASRIDMVRFIWNNSSWYDVSNGYQGE